MTSVAALLAVAAALVAWPSPGAGRSARLRAVGLPPTVRRTRPAARGRRPVLPVLAGLAVALLVGGGTGVALGAVVGVLADRWLRRVPGSGPAGALPAEELPVACDLLGVCLAAGLTVGGALAAVATALPGPLGDALAAVAGRLRLGAAPRTAWHDAPPELAGLGRVLVRAGESGAAAAPALRTLAAEARAAARSRAEAGVRRAGVWVLAPLGLCFLPAFVCLGIAPMIIGIAGQVFR
ncbi:type II secretion system (T2SS) protein F [Geodermatophilus normandii]|uniref:Type II secretion system (T2SS) protein F n=1 Tax=Geodermatophilus normandii TaxID=1137989 RepID=A0A317QE15_9ACTN|nr:type II secretion system F family protein [Geodermatophilus normandii]PWW21612.1 type II secretion system (T2SS) protein F [Geodermatophilus normandii]